MTEQQRYELLRRYGEVELRRYPEQVIAEIEVGGTFESAGNRAFRPLAGYIGGRNRLGGTPVVTPQQPGGSTRIAMTAPVVQEPGAEPGTYLVSFVMPAGSRAETLPEPVDPRVTIRTVPEQQAAALRFSGRWTRSSYRAKCQELLRAVRERGLEVAGPVRYARFDPPWTPWFLRRNEVVVPVVGA